MKLGAGTVRAQLRADILAPGQQRPDLDAVPPELVHHRVPGVTRIPVADLLPAVAPGSPTPGGEPRPPDDVVEAGGVRYFPGIGRHREDGRVAAVAAAS